MSHYPLILQRTGTKQNAMTAEFIAEYGIISIYGVDGKSGCDIGKKNLLRSDQSHFAQ